LHIPNQFNTPLADIAKTSLSLNKLQSGQQIYVDVVEQVANKTTTILRIGQQLIAVKTDIPLTPGQTLKVVVETSSDGITLKLPAKAESSHIINTALRQLLPKQTAVAEFQAPLVKTLRSLQQPPSTPTNLNRQVQLQHLSGAILQTLTLNQKITTASGLKAALQNSGTLLEARLLQSLSVEKNVNQQSNLKPTGITSTPLTHHSPPPLIVNDLKANLSKLIQLLRSWPGQQTAQPPQGVPQQTPISATTAQTATNISIAQQLQQFVRGKPSTPNRGQANKPELTNINQQVKELLGKTEGALAKITLNQLASSNTENNTARQTWQIEIPLFNPKQAESIFIKIEGEQANSKTAQKNEQHWRISLEMSPPKLGLIRTQLRVLNDHVSSNFWAENSDTRDLIQQHIELLRKRFSRANLHTDHIRVQQGAGPEFQNMKQHNNIISEQA